MFSRVSQVSNCLPVSLLETATGGNLSVCPISEMEDSDHAQAAVKTEQHRIENVCLSEYIGRHYTSLSSKQVRVYLSTGLKALGLDIEQQPCSLHEVKAPFRVIMLATNYVVIYLCKYKIIACREWSNKSSLFKDNYLVI